MLRMDIKGVLAVPMMKEPLTAGRIGLRIEFTFSHDWDDLEKYVVFEGSASKDVALIGEDACVVPWECLATAGPSLRVGVYGMKNEDDELVKATPTVWASFGRIESGAVRSESSSVPPTEDVVTEILEAARTAVETANDAKETAEGVAEAAARGDYDGEDGYSPEVTIASISGGHSVTITDADHPGGQSFNVMDGTNGTNGTNGTDGSLFWTTDVEPTESGDTLVYSFSDLSGRLAATPSIGDLIFYGGTYYPVTRVVGTTVAVSEGVPIGGDIFWVTRTQNPQSTTTVFQIRMALFGGKLVMCRYQGRIYTLTSIESDTRYRFTSVDGPNVYLMDDNDNLWTDSRYTIPHT